MSDADAAFIGTLIDVRRLRPEPSGWSGEPTVFTYQVEERIKGALPERVEVISPASTASCGLPASVGERVSLVLRRGGDGAWHAGLSDIWSAEFLRQGSLPLPQPTGRGQARLVAGGSFGEARTATLDGNGQVLAYGRGAGSVTSLSVCPGGRVAVELVSWRGRVLVATRRLPSLRLLAEREVAPAGRGEEVVCRTPSASDLLIVVTVSLSESAESQLLRISSVGTRTLERAQQLHMVVGGDKVFVSLAIGELFVRDLASGTRRSLAPTAGSLAGMSVSPDARFLAGFSGAQLTVVDLLRGTTKSRRRTGHFRETVWIGSRRLVAWSGSGRRGGSLEVFDQSLRPLRSRVPWTPHVTAIAGQQAFGVDYAGALLQVGETGDVTRRGQLFSPGISTLTVLPPA